MTYTPLRAVLTSGSAHDDVHVLGAMLAELGYETSVSRGENPFGIVDDGIIAAVNLYRAAAGIEQECDVPGVAVEQRARWIGPNFWDGALTPAGKLRKPAA